MSARWTAAICAMSHNNMSGVCDKRGGRLELVLSQIANFSTQERVATFNIGEHEMRTMSEALELILHHLIIHFLQLNLIWNFDNAVEHKESVKKFHYTCSWFIIARVGRLFCSSMRYMYSLSLSLSHTKKNDDEELSMIWKIKKWILPVNAPENEWVMP
jgi:hypothetical protein